MLLALALVPLQQAQPVREAAPAATAGSGSITGLVTSVEDGATLPGARVTLASREVAGLYPCGEGAGYAGGMVSAALDGRRVAAALSRVLA